MPSAERHRRGRAPVALAAALVAAAALAGCGSGSDGAPHGPAQARAVQRYLAQVEPIRRGVNRLLDRADPVLRRYAHHRLDAGDAQRQMSSLESRFDAFAVEVNGLAPVPVELAAAQRAYAHTYVLEDAYLRALTAAIPASRFDGLPKTQRAQRAAIVAWRTRLQLVAERDGVRLPGDVRFAGRGEIAPSPLGS